MTASKIAVKRSVRPGNVETMGRHGGSFAREWKPYATKSHRSVDGCELFRRTYQE